MTARLYRLALELALPAALIALWWVWTSSSAHLYYPPAPRVLHVFRDTWLSHGFVTIAVPSLEDVALGYLAGAGIGIVLGIGIGSSPLLRSSTSSLRGFFLTLPPPSLLPVFLLMLGIGRSMHVGFIAFGVLWPVLLNTIDGVAGVDLTLRDVARVYRVRPLQRLARVTLPAASPSILAGMRVALSLAVVLMVVGELAGSQRGIGFFLLNAQDSFDLTSMWAGIIFVALISYLLNLAFVVLVEKRVLFWQARRNYTARG